MEALLSSFLLTNCTFPSGEPSSAAANAASHLPKVARWVVLDSDEFQSPTRFRGWTSAIAEREKNTFLYTVGDSDDTCA